MKNILLCLLLLAAPLSAPAQARLFSQPELDALLAPVALYPDSLLDQILVAATSPQKVAEAAQWSKANSHLSGDEAVRAVQPYGWPPSVAALVAFPEVLARMAESPLWVRELGEAYLAQEPYVLDTVQQLRRRAEASGNLRSDEHQQVYRQGATIVVQPVHSEVVYVRYYNPLVVFGPWWWPSYHPIFWRPWQAHPVRFHWVQHHRPRVQVHQPRPVQRAAPVRRVHAIERQRVIAPQVRPMPAPSSYSQPRPAPRREAQQQPHREVQHQPRAQPQPRQAQQQRRDRRG